MLGDGDALGVIGQGFLSVGESSWCSWMGSAWCVCGVGGGELEGVYLDVLVILLDGIFLMLEGLFYVV